MAAAAAGSAASDLATAGGTAPQAESLPVQSSVCDREHGGHRL